MRFACPACKSVLECSNHKAGQKVACPKCGQRLQIPTLTVPTKRNKTVLGSLVGILRRDRVKPMPQQAAKPSLPAPPKVAVTCPGCGRIIRLPPEEATQKIECAACETHFIPQLPLAADQGDEKPPSSGTSKGGGTPGGDRAMGSRDDDCDEDYEDRPRRRTRHEDDEDRRRRRRREEQDDDDVDERNTGRARRGRDRDYDEQEEQAPRRRGRDEPLIVMPTKSVGISIILTFLFGPLGMLYSTVTGGLVMMAVNGLLLLIALCTAGIGALLFLITWPICIIWAAMAASSYNQKLLRGQRHY